MLNNSQQTYNDRSVEALEVCSELIRRELFLVGDVQVKITRDWIRNGLDMVHLLGHRQ